MNGVDELTNEISWAAIEVYRPLIISAISAVNTSPQFGPRNTSFLRNPHPPPTFE